MMKIEKDGSAGQEESTGLTLDEFTRIGTPRMRKATFEKVCGMRQRIYTYYHCELPEPTAHTVAWLCTRFTGECP